MIFQKYLMKRINKQTLVSQEMTRHIGLAISLVIIMSLIEDRRLKKCYFKYVMNLLLTKL